ncbi:MFS transporter [Oligoflexaceae bacterium]|nr:MFS transporter [Oligoflexaceae bacterium]
MTESKKSNYLDLLSNHRRLIFLGVYHTFASSFGQTIIVALFLKSVCSEFGLTAGQYGTIYGGVTVLSALTLTVTGPVVDRVHLRWYSLTTAVTLSAGAAVMALANSITLVVIGLFLVRHGGQALMPHCTSTTMARYFKVNRGKALALSNLGYAIGEGLLPGVIGYLLMISDWQTVYACIALLVLPAGLMASFGFIKMTDDFANPMELIDKKDFTQSARPSEVLRQQKFYLVLPCYLMAPFVLTGFLFYQAALADSRGWSLAFVATSLSFFAGFRFIFSFVSGFLIDKFSAQKMMIFHLLPLTIGLLILLVSRHSFTAILFWACCGATVGLGSNIKQALWAELYGTAFLGAVKSIIAPFTVVSTAFSPFLFGMLIDGGIAINIIITASIFCILVSMLLCFFGMKGFFKNER